MDGGKFPVKEAMEKWRGFRCKLEMFSKRPTTSRRRNPVVISSSRRVALCHAAFRWYTASRLLCAMTSGWHAASCLRPKCAREQGFVVPIKPKGRRRNGCGKLSVDSCRTRHATMLAECFSHPKAVMVHPSGALANKLTATCQGPGDLRHARIAEPSPMASSDTLALEDSIPIYPGKIGMGGENSPDGR